MNAEDNDFVPPGLTPAEAETYKALFFHEYIRTDTLSEKLGLQGTACAGRLGTLRAKGWIESDFSGMVQKHRKLREKLLVPQISPRAKSVEAINRGASVEARVRSSLVAARAALATATAHLDAIEKEMGELARYDERFATLKRTLADLSK